MTSHRKFCSVIKISVLINYKAPLVKHLLTLFRLDYKTSIRTSFGQQVVKMLAFHFALTASSEYL